MEIFVIKWFIGPHVALCPPLYYIFSDKEEKFDLTQYQADLKALGKSLKALFQNNCDLSCHSVACPIRSTSILLFLMIFKR